MLEGVARLGCGTAGTHPQSSRNSWQEPKLDSLEAISLESCCRKLPVLLAAEVVLEADGALSFGVSSTAASTCRRPRLRLN